MIKGIIAESTKEAEVLDNIPFKLEIDRIMMRLRFFDRGESHRFENMVPELIEMVVPLAKPKAIYKVSRVSSKTRDSLEIDDVKFTNYLLRVNLDKVDQVFPYVLTCGQRLDSISIPAGEVNQSHCLEVIKELILAAAATSLQEHITRQYKLDYLWSLSPGELPAWPKVHQKPLLSILGNVEALIGVKLTKDYSLVPAYSQCGIFYYAETEFESCQVCPQEPCMGRRAAYNAELAQKYSSKARKPCGSITIPRLQETTAKNSQIQKTNLGNLPQRH